MRGGSVSDFIPRSLCLAVALCIASSAQAADPTRPPAALRAPTAATEAAPAAPMKLQAVLRGGAAARAVIDGQTVEIGQHIGDARVLAIQANSVLIERQGQRETLRLAAPIITPSRAQR